MKIYDSTAVLLLGILACLQVCTSFPITTSNPPPTQTNNVTATQVQPESPSSPKNESHNQPIDKDASEKVMYSYAEAVVDPEGTPSVHQLTIAKGKDGGFRYAKNENGTVEAGNWKGPLPVSPVEPEMEHPAKILGTGVSSIVNQELSADPLTEFNKNIGDTLQNYIFKSLMPLQLTF